MSNGQLELTLANERGNRQPSRRPRPTRHAHWWFVRMREVVDRALDWQAAPPPPQERPVHNS